jgi:hypothetical protein
MVQVWLREIMVIFMQCLNSENKAAFIGKLFFMDDLHVFTVMQTEHIKLLLSDIENFVFMTSYLVSALVSASLGSSSIGYQVLQRYHPNPKLGTKFV